MNTKYIVSVIALVLATSVSLPAVQPEQCVVIVDDVSGPAELAQHGIAPASPDSLGLLFDAIANSRQAVTLSYIVVREKGDRNVPVCVTITPFTKGAPQRPDRNLPMADLETATVAYRRLVLEYETAEGQYRERAIQDRDRFVRAAMDAQAAADAERDTLKSARSYAASDIEGAVLGAVNVIRASGAPKGILLLNSDLADAVRWRKHREKPFTADELPQQLVRSVLFINSSFRPDASPLFKDAKCERLHAGNLATAAELVRGQVESRAPSSATLAATSN